MRNVGELYDIVEPIQVQLTSAITPPPTPLIPINGTFALFKTFIRLLWQKADDYSQLFEIRQGAVWDTAEFITRTPSTQADLEPTLVGSTPFLVKSINSAGVYSETALQINVVVPAIGTTAMTAQVIDNNVLLYWTEPNSAFQIDYYKLERSASATPTVFVLIGNKTGTFTSVFEVVSDTYIYKLTPYDIAGNSGPSATITQHVNQPPDFNLQDSRISDLNGTRVKAYRFIASDGNPRLLAPVNITEDWEDHFLNNSWDQPSDQVAAGYPIYIQPAQNTATYTEVIDYGGVFNNLIVNLQYAYVAIVGNVAITFTMESSLDNVIWSAPVAGASAFFASMRYLRIIVTFDGDDATHDLVEFYNLTIRLDVKRETDSGAGTASSGDATGTVFTFNKVFKDVDSVVATSKVPTKEPLDIIVDFVDAPNPVSFKVLVYDTAGQRKTIDIMWVARGIV